MKAEFCVIALSLLFVAFTAHGHTDDNSISNNNNRNNNNNNNNSARLQKRAAATGNGTSAAAAGRRRREAGRMGLEEVEEEEDGGEGACEEGWLATHNYCLLYTGMAEVAAEEFCAKRGALQVRGICIDRPSRSTHLQPQRQRKDILDTITSSSSTSSSSSVDSSGHHCPRGWAQVEDYCYFNPGPASKVCELLGASYILNLCVARVPHQVPADFMHAVKRLHGDDNHLDRETRLCCCLGGGFC